MAVTKDVAFGLGSKLGVFSAQEEGPLGIGSSGASQVTSNVEGGRIQENYNNAAANTTTPIRSTRSVISTQATPGIVHLYDTGKEGGSFETDIDLFSNVNGETKTWSPRHTIDDQQQSNVGRRREHFFPDTMDTPLPSMKDPTGENDGTDGILHKPLHEMLPLPSNYDEWVVPNFCNMLHLPTPELVHRRHLEVEQQCRRAPILVDRTENNVTSPSSVGMEAMYLSPTTTPRDGILSSEMKRGGVGEEGREDSGVLLSHTSLAPHPSYLPMLVTSIPSPPNVNINNNSNDAVEDEENCIYVPILAIKHQSITENERYHEDPAIVDVQVAYTDGYGMPPKIVDEEDGDDDDDDFKRNSNVLMHNVVHTDVLKKSPWTPSSIRNNNSTNNNQPTNKPNTPIILLRHNLPQGFCDLPFPGTVLDRFPSKNYRGLPFPEEELPMFCYARGSLLVRDKLRNGMKLPKCYGFVVKNERGDSIYGK